MKKPLAVISVLLLFVLFLPGCKKQEGANTTVGGKIYSYSAGSFSKLESDSFAITIQEDGTYSYHESILSSYIGSGKWSVTGDVLPLSDDTGVEPQRVNHFFMEGNDLIFVEENSSNFGSIKVKDGERFHGSPIGERSKKEQLTS